MTQTATWSVPLFGPASPTLFAQRIDDSLDALLSSHSGSARPSYAVAGTMWLNTASAGLHKYYFFDGTTDRLVLTINTSTGAIQYADGVSNDALATKAPISVYAAKSSGYTAVAADAGKTLRFTAAATLALTAAAALGNGWSLNVVADGGAVTIDPNGSETINGQTTLVVPNGTSATIICDGSNFFTVVRSPGWETIYSGAFSAASAVDFTNLGAYRRLRLVGKASPSVGSNSLFLRTSTNNGSSYDAGASDYAIQRLTVASSSATPAFGVGSAFDISQASANDANAVNSFDIILESFNEATAMTFNSRFVGVSSSAFYSAFNTGGRNSVAARNALRLLPGSGTITGSVTLQGVRS